MNFYSVRQKAASKSYRTENVTIMKDFLRIDRFTNGQGYLCSL